MPELIQDIKDLAHQVSEDYLLLGEPMNPALLSLHEEGKIANDEILKRVCEQANSNVYLALFHDEDTDRSNIQFDLADFEKVSEQIQTSEQAMKDYQTPPEDFRSLLELAIVPTEGESPSVKLAALREAVEYRDAFRKFHSQVEVMRNSEIQSAENAFNKMAHEAKLMVVRGDSIGDIAKIASRGAQELGLDQVKVAKAYDLIHRELVRSGFHVKTGFTKLSSMRVNTNADVLQASQEFALSLEKVAAIQEMDRNVSRVLESFDKLIKTEEAK